MTDSVVITRPLQQAGALMQGVAALGRKAVLFPLLEIHPVPDRASLQAALDALRDFALVAFVSPNAIDAAFALLKDWPRDVPLAVMGEGSRATLARHGLTSANATIFSPRDADRTDSQTLLAALDLDALRGKRVLILRGETGRELLGDALRSAGAAVTQVAAYRRCAPQLDEARRAQLIELLATDNQWIVTSSEALKILIRMVEQLAGVNGVAKMQHQRLIVPHARIEETAAALGFTRVTLTGSGDERLLAALQS
jgi:uroporphyrinogen-III synthase